ncbi:endoglucanase [Tissierella praeacuta DSM 18095]|uniref:Endoglucanase n=1 Tax=Tissierella praeacuta DSM 18095 TaxID=1123404 RepID=A0A1M4SG74_9FIRM|nr:M42 family metallopeptidase [Tissierella praeacuta]TCU72733.1 endoglucanase [Tissierella praeacuta]SHE31200.1 endoglucanase [Tissierella praeacuta DSM 18095]SUP01396.1 Putative aminopeptidase ysdC [Tissierella praeacuta]
MSMNFSLLKELVGVYGPASNEKLIREYILNEIKDYVDEMEIDALGNLIARKKGNGKKVMISAHMDQIGLMVIDIDEKGFLRFTNVGGISPVVSLSQQVIFENGTIGVVYAEPIEDISKLKLENMYIDIGAFSKEEAEKKINIGDICIYKSEYIENENVVFTPYLDDRVGCFIAIEALKSIKNPVNDLYFVFSVQEEVGLRGAKTAAYRVEPDIGIALDVTSHGDTPKAKRFAIGLNKGASIKVKDNSIICHPKVKDLLVSLAKDNRIPYQMEVLEFGGTDSGVIHINKEGVPSGVISIPTRYVHSTIEMASKDDIINCTKLLVKFLEDKLDI